MIGFVQGTSFDAMLTVENELPTALSETSQ